MQPGLTGWSLPDYMAAHHVISRARREGYHVGAAQGDAKANPYRAGLPAFEAWIEGYREGRIDTGGERKKHMTTKRAERASEMRNARDIAILEAAVAEANEKGFAGVRQEAVAKRAGVSKGLVTHAFGTMDALKSAVMELAIERGMTKIVAAGLALDHPVARNAPPGLRARAAAAIS